MRIVTWFTLVIAIVALLCSITAYRETCRQTDRIDEGETAMYANVDEAMTSVANSFKLNRLDYNLHWRTKNGTEVRVGVFK
ncbi:unnamed protein product [marine sediment metagenome]|uniref:Uncharacterized protein n=1 Tax=marine sediment metagenome TaxID=412755 RepID=X1KUH5_9ZZZZ